MKKPVANDFAKFQKLIDKISEETWFTNQYFGQPKKDVSEIIEAWNNPNFFPFFAIDGEDIIAVAGLKIDRPEHPWLKYTASFGISILKDYWDKGLGGKLLDIIQAEARKREIHRIEGQVRAANIKGVSLYLKQGFVIEGLLRDKAFINNEWQDEYIIAKIL